MKWIAVLLLVGLSKQAEAQVRDCPSLSLYCIQLLPTEAFDGARAYVELARPVSAFGVAVTRDGIQRYQFVLDIEGLPELGASRFYVLWVMPLSLDPVTRLGLVGNGHFEIGEVALNKFLLVVSLESSPNPPSRTGPLVLRGRSPSSLLEAHDLFQVSAFADPSPKAEHQHDSLLSIKPTMNPLIRMMDAMMLLEPTVRPWLPDLNLATREAQPRQLIRLEDGDAITLRAHPVYKVVGGHKIAMLGYNGQIPGPLLDVEKNVTVHVTFINDTPFESSIHWHGLRHDNAFDGVPGMTQDAVLPGGSFKYTVRFPDAGLYWYHPHQRSDIQQDLGLYGNMIVRAPDGSYLGRASREEVIVLDDITLTDRGNLPYGEESSNHAFMGRFGNVLLINGEPSLELHTAQGDTLRFFTTNVSNTRTWNVSLENHSLLVVASDLSPFEMETWEESLTIGPAERYVVDIFLAEPGKFALLNKVQSLNHTTGVFFSSVDTLGWVTVETSSRGPLPIHTTKGNQRLRVRQDVQTEIAEYLVSLDGILTDKNDPAGKIDLDFKIQPDKEIDLLMRTNGLPPLVQWLLNVDQSYFQPVEWSETMPFMNWSATNQEVEWIVREPSTGLENMDIGWSFELNTTHRIRINNRRDSQHAMQHPIHLHGQRFLVLSYNGRPIENRAWKDTVLIPAGMTVDILVDFTNPGHWMLHCHIAEHLESGMMLGFDVH